MNNVQAALAYAAAGMYVLPVRRGEKRPGSVVGENWPALSTVDVRQIRDWWQEDPDYGIAMHCGRSGLYVIDVDNPEVIPLLPQAAAWVAMLAGAPANGTRAVDNGKGHYFYLMPADKLLGNGKGSLPKGWGDVRGANGIVMMPPSTHPGQLPGCDAKDAEGEYWQRRAGVIPDLPVWFKEAATAAQAGEYALTDLELKRFLKQHSAAAKPALLKAVLQSYTEQVEAGESRHVSSILALCWALREARAGMYSAATAVTALQELFQASLNEEGRERPAGEGEWQENVRWAAAQALASDPAKVRAEIEQRGKQQQAARESDGLFHLPPGVDTEQEHARAIIRWISDRAVYAWDADSWVLKQENRWRIAPRMESRGVLSMVAENMPPGDKPEEDEATEWTDANWEWLLRQRYQSSQKSAGIAQKITSLVTTDNGSSPYVTSLAATDVDTGVLWTPNGPVDLLHDRTQEEAVDRLAVHLHCTAYPALPVETPLWHGLLEAVWPDPAVRAWALQLLAVGVTGLSPRMFIYLYGERSRGKTSVPYLISDVLGTYARADLNSSMISRDAKPWDRAALHGLRFGLIDEMPSGAGGPTEILKRITGGAPISAEYKNKPQFTFKPTHTLVFASNGVPDLQDPAVDERLRAIACTGRPATVRAARAKIGEVTGTHWQREAPGVLYQLIELARAYMRNNDLIDQDRSPVLVKRATSTLRSEQNVLEQWLEENTKPFPPDLPKRDWATPTHIYDVFMTWCKRNHRGRRYLNDSYGVDNLGRELSRIAARKGYLHCRYGGMRRWNIDLNPAHIKGK